MMVVAGQSIIKFALQNCLCKEEDYDALHVKDLSKILVDRVEMTYNNLKQTRHMFL